MKKSQSCCPLCRGDKVPGTTTFAEDLGSGVIVVREVPATVCDQCGESWSAHKTALKLEVLVEESRRKQSLVEVTHWQDEA